MLSLVWSPEFVKGFSTVKDSPLSSILEMNDRSPARGEANKISSNGTCAIYPNLGLGQMLSCMVEYNSTQYAVREVKVYCSTSQIWRNNAPYDGTCYTIAAVPFDLLFSGSGIPANTQRFICEK